MVSRDVFCLKGAQLIWLEPRADGDEVTAQAQDLHRTIKRVPLRAPDVTQVIAFPPSGDYVSSATYTTTLARPGGK